MNTLEGLYFHDSETLLERLSNGLKRRTQEVVFLLGAPFSAPLRPGDAGVPNVEGVIELIRSEFLSDPAQISALDQTLASAAADRRYQTAFVFVQGRRGPQTANEIVRTAVRAARLPGSVDPGPDASDDACRVMEADNAGWALAPGIEALGRLAADYSGRFGRTILTTNFDPLLEVAIRRAHGHYYRTTLHSDGNLSQTEGDGCHVIHLHGYWYGSDTLHTTRQLGQPRPRLRAALASLLRHKLVVVCGYGGWDDAFTEAMMEVVRDDSAFPEIIWCFHEDNPSVSLQLANRLGPGVDRGRVTLYSGIDCNDFFPRLHGSWSRIEGIPASLVASRTNQVQVNSFLYEHLTIAPQNVMLEGDDEDRPPVVDICVGRGAELKRLSESDARAVFINGIGGQGKSTVAAEYFERAQSEGRFSFFTWRDCKEERERFENQLASVIESLSAGRIRGSDLAKQSAAAIVDILMELIKDLSVLFVFDNVDHYVDLETGRLVGTPDTFVSALLKSGQRSRAVFTCRPSVRHQDPTTLSIRLEGISVDAATELFEARKADVSAIEVQEAHRVTNGHPFWLDLLAVQAAQQKQPGVLRALLKEIQSGEKALLPQKTIQSIWTKLRDRDRLVLRAMAETVKPDTDAEIAEYLARQLHYNKVMQSLRALRAQNLIVVKKRSNSVDLLELHPLVRQFIRSRFPPEERLSFIQAIRTVYELFRGTHQSQLTQRPSFSMLQHWSQNAELDIAAGRIDDAFATLAEVADAFSFSGYSREYCRVARILLDVSSWSTDFGKYENFEPVFRTHIDMLSYLGEDVEVDELLKQYEMTSPARDARYIGYAEMQSQSRWLRGDFASAVEWGRKGLALKSSSDVDTETMIEHVLALAERDAGNPEAALRVFLEGQQLSQVVDPDELTRERGGEFYGNVGRCLHLMGQVEQALVCYQKSALLIETDPSYEHLLNQGYIRSWVGELLVAKDRFRVARLFYIASAAKWRTVFPARAARMLDLSRQLLQRTGDTRSPTDREAEQVCRDWIFGRLIDE